MSQISIFPENCKFATVAVQNVHVDLPPLAILKDGTAVVTKIPFPIDDHWRTWLGAMQSHQLSSCNLFLVSIATSGWPEGQLSIFGGNLDSEQMQHVGGIFAFLRIIGTLGYSDAFVVAGHVENGQPEIRHFAKTERFNITRGSLPWIVRQPDLEAAAQLSDSYKALLRRFPGERWRFGRGCHALKTAMEQHFASDRLHGFVRALEALILPEPGKTEKQFISRCAFMAGPTAADREIRSILQEAYRMRCDIEHVHDWDRSFTAYPAGEKEHIAYWRTRQMEELACAAYRKIISDPVLQSNFYDDLALHTFWQKSETYLRTALGGTCDITKIRPVKKYDPDGWADPSEWPADVFASLAKSA
jgi:hypothetical protein